MMNQTLRCIAGVLYARLAHVGIAAVAAILVSAGMAPAALAATAPARVVTASDGSVVFRVSIEKWDLALSDRLEGTVRMSIPGYSPVGAPGEPALPARQFLVALPPEGGYRVAYRVLESEPLGRRQMEPVPFQTLIQDDNLGRLPEADYRRDGNIWAAFQSPPTVEARDPGWIRHNRVLPVIVTPLTYDASSGEAVLATRIEVTVTFRSEGSGRPARPLAEAPGWEGLFGRLVVNAAQARQFRVPSPHQATAGISTVPRAVQQGSRVRIKVRRTGVHKVTAAGLIAAGFPAGRSVGDLHLFQRTYNATTLTPGVDDVALEVREDASGTAGIFDGADLLIFYGRRLRDDPDQADAIEKFADHNVYWLGTTGGPQMAPRTLTPGFVTADTASAFFPVDDHFEEDNGFFEGIRPDMGPDFYGFNEGFEPGPIDLPLHLWAVRPGTNVTLSAQLMGLNYRTPRFVWTGLFNSRGEIALNASLSIPGKTIPPFSGPTPGTNFDVGANSFRVRRIDGSRPGVDVVVNWARVQYQALYRAHGNRLDFNTATLSGDTSVTVTGLSSQNVSLYDITDPDTPIRCVLDAGLFTDVGGSFALSFRDAITTQKRYSMWPEAAMFTVAAADITMDVPSAIIGSAAEGGVDVLVVSHADFISNMNAWVSYRRAQGYRVLMADVQDVYDEFNNGVPAAHAIDRFTRRFFELGGASTLLLVGDCSEDNKRVHSTSGRNFVPSHSWADNVGSLQLDEVVTTDKKFVLLPPPGGGPVDVFPDMAVGRLPVGSAPELAVVLNKIFKYDQPRASEFWRRRILVFADDRFSVGSSSFGGFQFCPQAETGFQIGQEQAAVTMESGIGGYDVVRFYLSTFTESFYGGSADGCQSQFAAILFGRANVNPPWMAELNQGASIVTIQAHMNRSLVTHESVFTTLPAANLGSATGSDHLRIDNRDRPFIIFGMGCHFSDYALLKEQFTNRVTENSPNGDAFAEQLLFANNRGAASTYGSSGFEYLHETNAFMNMVANVWFYDAPYDTMINQTQGQWVFGELMFLVENQMASAQPKPIERYHILGDPLLRIDAGPPAFDVTVNGIPFENDGRIGSGGGQGDTLRVSAVVSDENAIHEFKLEIDGVDESGALAVTPLVDTQLANSRRYRLDFTHLVRPGTYDLVMRAFQSPDTTVGTFTMAAEFVMHVETSVLLTVNGRTIQSGENVPSRGNYRIELSFPVVVPQAQLGVTFDDIAVPDLMASHPAPEDSTTWILTFSKELGDGSHVMKVTAGANEFLFTLVVSSAVGLRNVMPYPNPFTDGAHVVYEADTEISEGRVDIYTTSGKRVRRIVIPPQARQPGQSAVFWDGRDTAGDTVANGTYLFIVTVTQRGQSSTVKGKISRLR